MVVADAGHDEILALGRLFRRRRAFAAVLGHPFFRLGGGTVVDGDLVPAFRLEMPGHRVAHHAEAYECDLCHFVSSMIPVGHGPAGGGPSTGRPQPNTRNRMPD